MFIFIQEHDMENCEGFVYDHLLVIAKALMSEIDVFKMRRIGLTYGCIYICYGNIESNQRNFCSFLTRALHGTFQSIR